MQAGSLVIQTSSKTCHPEGRAVCGPKDLNPNFDQDAAIELLRLSSSDSLRMTPACPLSPLLLLSPYPRSFFLRSSGPHRRLSRSVNPSRHVNGIALSLGGRGFSPGVEHLHSTGFQPLKPAELCHLLRRRNTNKFVKSQGIPPGGTKGERRSASSQAPPLLLQRKPCLTGSPPSRQKRRCQQECRVLRVYRGIGEMSEQAFP